jgi:hypothetical protein
MNIISTDPRLPMVSKDEWYLTNLNARLYELHREVATLLNAISTGRIEGTQNAATAAPTTGTNFVGDFVRNLTPAEAGVGGSKYVVIGWVCSVSGTPGTWLECRCLTGS